MNGNAHSVLRYFGLSEQPFAATADPLYFFAAREHKECLFRLWNHIDDQEGIAVILGNYGTGKTTLLRKLITGMRSDPGKYNTAVIGSPIPSWTSFSLLESIINKFGIRPPERSFIQYIEALNRYLLSKRDRITTLIIDDAQNLNKRGQLELLRLAQNLETPQHKLLNLVFFAQLEWAHVLRAAPNFLQRISLTYTIRPVNEEETGELIRFRLRQAGAGERGPLFDESALKAIHIYTEGVPREVITLCRNALFLAAQLRTRNIGQAVIMHTIQKTMLPDRERQERLATALGAQGVSNTSRASLSGNRAVVYETTDLKRARANKMLLRAAREAVEKPGSEKT